MNPNGQAIEVPDFRLFEENRARFPLDELIKYAGLHIAFSPDGTRILASGESREAVDANLAQMGIHFSQVVFDYVDPLD